MTTGGNPIPKLIKLFRVCLPAKSTNASHIPNGSPSKTLIAVAIPDTNNVIVITWKTSLSPLVNSSRAFKAPSMIVFTIYYPDNLIGALILPTAKARGLRLAFRQSPDIYTHRSNTTPGIEKNNFYYVQF
jgi:hypothetical protein